MSERKPPLEGNAPIGLLLAGMASMLFAGCSVFEKPQTTQGEDDGGEEPDDSGDSGGSSDGNIGDSGGEDNSCPGPIKINEIDGTPSTSLEKDFVELFNSSNMSMNVGGLQIVDDRGGGPDASKARM